MQNELTELDLTNNPKLEFVDICANQIRTNLSIFSHLVNLKELHLG
jgi:Leucine-rich repeat (LRR) protein